jgi:hypothetical protein
VDQGSVSTAVGGQTQADGAVQARPVGVSRDHIEVGHAPVDAFAQGTPGQQLPSEGEGHARPTDPCRTAAREQQEFVGCLVEDPTGDMVLAGSCVEDVGREPGYRSDRAISIV